MSSLDPQPPTTASPLGPDDVGADAPPTAAPKGPAWYARRWVQLVAVAIFAFALGAVTGSSSQGGTAAASRPATTVTTTATVTSTQSVEQTTAATSAASSVPAPADFKPAIRVKSKECFGSAGCNIEYTIDLTWVGAGPEPDADVDYDITYQVTGGQDGAQIGTITASGAKYDNASGVVRTASTSSKLAVKITRVDAA